MKMSLVIFTVVTVASTVAQGTINFYNNNLTGPNGAYRAGVFVDDEPQMFNDPKGDSTIGAGPNYTAGLFLASDLNTPLATTPFRSTAPFEVFANFVPDVIIPGVPPGSTAQLVVRVWPTAVGSYSNTQWWELKGEQAFTSRALGGPNPDPTSPAIPSPDLGPGFTGFEMDVIPEPSLVALGAIGIGVVMLGRRRQSAF